MCVAAPDERTLTKFSPLPATNHTRECYIHVYVLYFRSRSMLQGFIARNNHKYAENTFTCTDGSYPRYKSGSYDRVVGIIGGQSSAVSIQLANLLRLFKVPQVLSIAARSAVR